MDILAETIDKDGSDTENGGAGHVVEKAGRVPGSEC